MISGIFDLPCNFALMYPTNTIGPGEASSCTRARRIPLRCRADRRTYPRNSKSYPWTEQDSRDPICKCRRCLRLKSLPEIRHHLPRSSLPFLYCANRDDMAWHSRAIERRCPICSTPSFSNVLSESRIDRGRRFRHNYRRRKELRSSNKMITTPEIGKRSVHIRG
jgi:hypothetical protein